jgi:hypothetical protein
VFDKLVNDGQGMKSDVFGDIFMPGREKILTLISVYHAGRSLMGQFWNNQGSL